MSTLAQTLDIQALQLRALQLWEADKASALELGRALLVLRDAMQDQHGAFTQWWRDNGLDENRVYYCMRKAEGKVSPSKQPAIPVSLPCTNFFIAKYATSNSSPESVVHVRSDGTTITDGLMLVHVSLPSDVKLAPDFEACLPADFVTEFRGENPQLTFAGSQVTATLHKKGQSITATQVASKFPGVSTLLAKHPLVSAEVPDDGVGFEADPKEMAKVLRVLEDFSAQIGGGAVRFSIKDGYLRVDMVEPISRQKLTALCRLARPGSAGLDASSLRP
jgi:hypothetical protein